MLRVSMVTPTLNQGAYLRRTIESVLAQHGPFELEYLVVDGGSTDGTLEILRDYRDRLSYTSQPDAGQIEAINAGLSRMTGDVFGWLNSDDLLLPRALARVTAAFQGHPEAEWVHGRCRIIDDGDREIQRWISSYKHFRCLRHSWRNLLAENYVSQMTVFWRRSAWDAVGPLEVSEPLAFDYDYWLRLARRGHPHYIPEPMAALRRHPASKTGRAPAEMFQQEYRVALRHAGDDRTALRIKRLRMAVFTAVYWALERTRKATRPHR